MGWFDSHDHGDLIAELRKLHPEDAKLHLERDALAQERQGLKKQVEDLKLERDRLVETHAREERELRHMIGLEKKRQEFEVAAGKRDAVLTVREENLVKDRERFEQQMKFQTDRFETELKSERELMQQILHRLPTVTVDKQVRESSHTGGPVKGK